MKLITEEVTNVKILTEGKGANKKLYIEGVFLQGGIKNRNGRMYPVDTLSREVNRYCETFVNKGRALGELGHPDGPTVNLDRCLLYTSPSPRDVEESRMPSSA